MFARTNGQNIEIENSIKPKPFSSNNLDPLEVLASWGFLRSERAPGRVILELKVFRRRHFSSERLSEARWFLERNCGGI